MRFDTFYELLGTGNFPYKEPEIADMDSNQLNAGIDCAEIHAKKNAERIKELKAELERRATSHRVDENPEKGSPKTLAELLSTEGRAWEFAVALVSDQLNGQQRELYQKAAKNFGEVMGRLSAQPIDERLKNGHKALAACIPACWASKDPETEYGIDFPLSFEAYQAGAKKTAIYNQDARVMYPALGLAGEVGEFIEKAGGITAGVDVLLNGVAVCAGKCANQVKKIIRDDCECDTTRKHAIGQEIGGVLWYCAAVASDLGLDLGDIAQENLDVLADRQKRGTIQGMAIIAEFSLDKSPKCDILEM